MTDLSKIAKEMESAAKKVGPDKVIETKSPLSFNEALKLRDGYLTKYSKSIVLHPLNEDVSPELSSYVVCLRGCNYNA